MKPSMLLVSAISPFPATSGGATRMYYTLKYLSQKYDLYYLTFGENVTNEEQKKFFDQHCKFWRVYPLKKRTLFSSIPYVFSCWRSGRLERMMGKILDEHDIAKIRIEFTQIAYLRRFLPADIPNTFVAHDLATITFGRRDHQPWPSSFDPVQLARSVTNHAHFIEVRAFEKMWLPLYDEVVTVSDSDAQTARSLFSLKSIRTEPNGLAEIQFLPFDQRPLLTCGYIGSPLHPPNQQALEFTRQHIFPRLTQAGIDYHYYLAGADHDATNDPRQTVLGEIKETKQFYSAIDFLLAPLFSGSGTRVKILESLSFGVPVITTPIGAEGLLIQSPFLQIVDEADPEKLAEKMTQLLLTLKKNYTQFTSPQNRRALEKQLRAFLWSRSFANS